MFTIQLGEDQYRIVAPNGDEGELFDYGDTAELLSGGERYIAGFDLDDNGDPEYFLPEMLMRVTVEPAKVEAVAFDGGDEEDVEVSGDGDEEEVDVEEDDDGEAGA